MIAEASRNAILAEYVNNIVARTNVYIVFYDPFYDIETNDSIAEHRALAGALRRRAADEAVELMRQHIRLSLGALSKPE